MNLIDIKENLCEWDDRNPNRPEFITGNLLCKCDCPNCTTGKTKLALAMLGMVDENDELKKQVERMRNCLNCKHAVGKAWGTDCELDPPNGGFSDCGDNASLWEPRQLKTNESGD